MYTFKEFIEERNIKDSPIQAFFVAKEKHKGQMRKDGTPYIRHPARVAAIIKQYYTGDNVEDIIRAAYLHDTIEDTDTTEEDIKKLFGSLVADMVKEVSSDKKEIEKIGKTEYLTQKMIKMSDWALIIKLADRLDNVGDIKTAKTPEWRRNYKNQTIALLTQLEKNRTLNATHKKLIALIKEKLDMLNEGLSLISI